MKREIYFSKLENLVLLSLRRYNVHELQEEEEEEEEEKL